RPFFSELAFEFQRECQRLEADLLLASLCGQEALEVRHLRRFVGGHVEGILYVPSGAVREADIQEVAQSNPEVPVVCVDRQVTGLDSVAVDGEAGTLEA